MPRPRHLGFERPQLRGNHLRIMLLLEGIEEDDRLPSEPAEELRRKILRHARPDKVLKFGEHFFRLLRGQVEDAELVDGLGIAQIRRGDHNTSGRIVLRAIGFQKNAFAEKSQQFLPDRLMSLLDFVEEDHATPALIAQAVGQRSLLVTHQPLGRADQPNDILRPHQRSTVDADQIRIHYGPASDRRQRPRSPSPVPSCPHR